MARPKPGFCINYRRDETHVSHWAASDFPQTAGTKMPLLDFVVCLCPVLSSSLNPSQSDAMKRAKVNCLTGTKTQ